MKTVSEFFKRAIVEDRQIQNQYVQLYSTFKRVDSMIQWAWVHWDDYVTSTFHTGVKPEDAPAAFALQYIENEDFEADGFDVEEIERIIN
jgi:hypothetical protein